MKIKVGSRIIARPSWGHGAPRHATVFGIEVTDRPGAAYGASAEEYDGDPAHICIDLRYDDDGRLRWAYGEQIACVLDEAGAQAKQGGEKP